MNPTPQHKDTTLDGIVEGFAINKANSQDLPTEDFLNEVRKQEHKAKQFLTQWRDKAVVEELETIYHKHGRTYKQTVIDGSGNVYVEDSHRYISSYEVQERILELKAQLKETPNED